MWIWLLWAAGLTISTLLGALLVRKRRDTLGYPSLVMVYVTYIIGANILASRIAVIDLGFDTMIIDSGIIIFPFVAQVIDMINEIYGVRKTYFAILLAFIANVLMSTFIYIASMLSPAPWLVEMDDAWRFFMMQTPRIVAASYVAFLVAQFIDATMFAAIKRRVYKGEVSAARMVAGSVLRSLGTDVVNMIVDSILFFPLAFFGVMPLWGLIEVTKNGAIIKVALTTLDTPWFIAYRLLTKGVKREY
jgi:uncharacterized integral membrane protein (TIGR00697 family)